MHLILQLKFLWLNLNLATWEGLGVVTRNYGTLEVITIFYNESNDSKNVSTMSKIQKMRSSKYTKIVVNRQNREISAEIRKSLGTRKIPSLLKHWMRCLPLPKQNASQRWRRSTTRKWHAIWGSTVAKNSMTLKEWDEYKFGKRKKAYSRGINMNYFSLAVISLNNNDKIAFPIWNSWFLRITNGQARDSNLHEDMKTLIHWKRQ